MCQSPYFGESFNAAYKTDRRCTKIVINENISLWGNNKIEERKIIAKEDWEFTIEKEK